MTRPSRAPHRTTRSLTASLLALALALGARSARAVDPFEIQVYDGTANDPQQAGLELHLNTVARGVRTAEPPMLAPDHQTHATLEPSFGMTPWWEIGGYLQSTLRGDGHFDYSGVKVRSKFVTPPKWHEHLRLGVNLEISALPSAYDPQRIGGEIRPVIAWEDDHWLFAVNPIVEIPFGKSEGPAFAPAFLAVRKIANVVAVGLEYYADVGPLGQLDPLHAQQHYLYETANLISIENLEINIGVGEGFTDASNGLVFKAIVGHTF